MYMAISPKFRKSINNMKFLMESHLNSLASLQSVGQSR